MINPNQTKTVFWLIVIIAGIALAAGVYFHCRKDKDCKLGGLQITSSMPKDDEDEQQE